MRGACGRLRRPAATARRSSRDRLRRVLSPRVPGPRANDTWLDTRVDAHEVTGTLGDGRPIPPHDEFYKELTTRNTPLVTPEEQERLRTATILVGGCGSVGGAAIEPLIRLGCEHLILAEPDG